MLSRTDIEADLARRDTEDLQDTFDALATWDGTSGIEGVESAADLMALFRRICQAMAGCINPTPPDTVRALTARMAVDATTAIATYEGAARFALHHHRTWWPAFAASFPEGEPPPP